MERQGSVVEIESSDYLRDLLSLSLSLFLFPFLSLFFCFPLFPPSYPFRGAFVFEEPGVFFSSVQSLSGT